MKKFKRTTVTSALPYANGPVHIGHLAGVYIPADIYVRYLRLKGEDVLFVGGSDEHDIGGIHLFDFERFAGDAQAEIFRRIARSEGRHAVGDAPSIEMFEFLIMVEGVNPFRFGDRGEQSGDMGEVFFGGDFGKTQVTHVRLAFAAERIDHVLFRYLFHHAPPLLFCIQV